MSTSTHLLATKTNPWEGDAAGAGVGASPPPPPSSAAAERRRQQRQPVLVQRRRRRGWTRDGARRGVGDDLDRLSARDVEHRLLVERAPARTRTMTSRILSGVFSSMPARSCASTTFRRSGAIDFAAGPASTSEQEILEELDEPHLRPVVALAFSSVVAATPVTCARADEGVRRSTGTQSARREVGEEPEPDGRAGAVARASSGSCRRHRRGCRTVSDHLLESRRRRPAGRRSRRWRGR